MIGLYSYTVHSGILLNRFRLITGITPNFLEESRKYFSSRKLFMDMDGYGYEFLQQLNLKFLWLMGVSPINVFQLTLSNFIYALFLDIYEILFKTLRMVIFLGFYQIFLWISSRIPFSEEFSEDYSWFFFHFMEFVQGIYQKFSKNSE